MAIGFSTEQLRSDANERRIVGRLPVKSSIDCFAQFIDRTIGIGQNQHIRIRLCVIFFDQSSGEIEVFPVPGGQQSENNLRQPAAFEIMFSGIWFFLLFVRFVLCVVPASRAANRVFGVKPKNENRFLVHSVVRVVECIVFHCPVAVFVEVSRIVLFVTKSDAYFVRGDMFDSPLQNLLVEHDIDSLLRG